MPSPPPATILSTGQHLRPTGKHSTAAGTGKHSRASGTFPRSGRGAGIQALRTGKHSRMLPRRRHHADGETIAYGETFLRLFPRRCDAGNVSPGLSAPTGQHCGGNSRSEKKVSPSAPKSRRSRECKCFPVGAAQVAQVEKGFPVHDGRGKCFPVAQIPRRFPVAATQRRGNIYPQQRRENILAHSTDGETFAGRADGATFLFSRAKGFPGRLSAGKIKGCPVAAERANVPPSASQPDGETFFMRLPGKHFQNLADGETF